MRSKFESRQLHTLHGYFEIADIETVPQIGYRCTAHRAIFQCLTSSVPQIMLYVPEASSICCGCVCFCSRPAKSCTEHLRCSEGRYLLTRYIYLELCHMPRRAPVVLFWHRVRSDSSHVRLAATSAAGPCPIVPLPPRAPRSAPAPSPPPHVSRPDQRGQHGQLTSRDFSLDSGADGCLSGYRSRSCVTLQDNRITGVIRGQTRASPGWSSL